MKWIAIASVLFCFAACKSREEAIKAANEEGKFRTEKGAALIKGVGDALKEKGSESAQAVAEGVGSIVKGVGRGFDKSLEQVKVTSLESLGTKGIKLERAAIESLSEGKGKKVTVYFVFEKAFKGVLQLRVLDEGGKEIGRSRQDVDEKEGNARFVDFQFDQRSPILTASRFEAGAP